VRGIKCLSGGTKREMGMENKAFYSGESFTASVGACLIEAPHAYLAVAKLAIILGNVDHCNSHPFH